jgi:hypothetical protein
MVPCSTRKRLTVSVAILVMVEHPDAWTLGSSAHAYIVTRRTAEAHGTTDLGEPYDRSRSIQSQMKCMNRGGTCPPIREGRFPIPLPSMGGLRNHFTHMLKLFA